MEKAFCGPKMEPLSLTGDDGGIYGAEVGANPLVR